MGRISRGRRTSSLRVQRALRARGRVRCAPGSRHLAPRRLDAAPVEALRNSDGTQTGFRGAYREVTPPERIVQTFEWDGMPGHVSVETATFEDLGEQTKVTTVSVFHTTEERDGMLASGMEGGLNETYDRLDEVLRRKA